MVSHVTQMLVDLLARAPGYGLGRRFFSDPGFHALDMEQVFYREWLFVAHSCELAEPGAYVTLRIGAYPVVIVRGRDRVLRAFHNVCRHRGQQVCTKPSGASGRLVCPYHQWTYDLDGRLLHARDMMGDIEASRFGLKPVACEEVAGWVFVSLAEDPAPFAPLRATIEPYMAPHRADEAKIALRSTIVEKGNWKLVLENNRECYHCRGTHPELSRVYSDAPALTGVEEVAEDGDIAAHWQACEAIGLPSTFLMDPGGQYRVVRAPFLRDAESMTLDGKCASSRLLADFPTARLGTMMFFHYPNSWNHLLADHAVSFRMLPLSPTETELTTTWLVHKDAVEGVDYDLRRLTEVWQATNDQDRRIVEGNQAGILSPAFEPGPYSRVHEGGALQFIDWYAGLMTTRLQALTGTDRAVA
ncbi:MAG TPA: aromatic ring-hydroxylating dioxygenase subunit alpha [Stellaceae bacterium]|nr:aromatic ring-hydroxylating dioxygenase subunit alpha [Stellaceae bacterium]